MTSKKSKAKADQTEYYNCPECMQDSVFSKVGPAPGDTTAYIMKAVHVDKSIPDHTWTGRDLFPPEKKNKSKSKLSKAAENKIEIANKASINAAELILEVYKQLLKDGWTEIQAGDICRKRLIIYSKSYIRKTLPDSSKHDSMRRPPLPHKEEETEAQIAPLESQIPNVPAAETVPPTPTVEIEKNLERDSPSVEKNIPLYSRQTQHLEEEPKEIYQIQPEEYSIHDLPKYDFDLRGEIIRYLDQENKRLQKIHVELKLKLGGKMSTELMSGIAQGKKAKEIFPSPSAAASTSSGFVSYQEACKYVNSQGVKSREQWRQFLRDYSIPPNIPRRPDNEYGEKKTGEWKGWKEFFEAPVSTATLTHSNSRSKK